MSGKIIKDKKWKDLFCDFSCFIIGCSPTILDIDLALINNSFTIGINNIIPLIDPYVLIWQDYEFWQDHHINIQKSKSFKICSNKADPLDLFFNFEIDETKLQIANNPSLLYGKSNTGMLAVQFAHTLGFKKMYLIGMDCCMRGKSTDWFGENKRWKSHTLEMCNQGLKWISANYGNKIKFLNSNESLKDVLRIDASHEISRADSMDMLKRGKRVS